MLESDNEISDEGMLDLSVDGREHDTDRIASQVSTTAPTSVLLPAKQACEIASPTTAATPKKDHSHTEFLKVLASCRILKKA